MTYSGSFFIVIVSLLLVAVNSFIILDPPELAGQFFISPRQVSVGPRNWHFDFTGQLAFANSSDIENKIVLIESARSDQEDAVNYSEQNVLGIISMQLLISEDIDLPGFSAFFWDGTDTSDVMLPVVLTSARSSHTLMNYLAEYGNITVRIMSNDTNAFKEFFDSPTMLAYGIFYPILSLACLGFAIYKQVMFIKFKGFQHSIAQTVLWLEIIGNSLRSLAALGDPYESRIYTLPHMLNQILYTITFPFAVLSVLLISFYWHELIAKVSVSITPFLKRLKVVFWVIFGVLMALEIITAIVRGVGYGLGTMLGYTEGTFYVAVVLATFAFFAYCGIKLYKELKKSNKTISDPESRMKKLRRTTSFIWMSSSMLLLWAITLAIGGLSDLLFIPVGFFIIWTVSNLLMTFLSFSQVFALHVPISKKSSSKLASSPRKSTPLEMVEN